MCSIHHELKLIFIHTPKCGGLYCQRLLEECYGFKTHHFTHENHAQFIDEERPTWGEELEGFLKITHQGVLRYFMTSQVHNDNMNMDQHKWSTYRKFAVIRNPYDRFISSYEYVKTRCGITQDIDEFINNRADVSDYAYFHTFIPQHEHLVDIHNNLNLEYIHFESLNRGLCDILLANGVPKIKHRRILLDNVKINTTTQSNYSTKYTDKMLKFVNEHFEKDFQLSPHLTLHNSIPELCESSKLFYKTRDEFAKSNISLLKYLDSNNLILSIEEVRDTICSSAPAAETIELENGMSIEIPNTAPKSSNNSKIPPREMHAKHAKNIQLLLSRFLEKLPTMSRERNRNNK